jgi:hypothetical protein
MRTLLSSKLDSFKSLLRAKDRNTWKKKIRKSEIKYLLERIGEVNTLLLELKMDGDAVDMEELMDKYLREGEIWDEEETEKMQGE